MDIFVHTNFASKLKHENLESNYQILYLSNDVGYNLCKSFTIKENPLILHFKKFATRVLIWLDLARIDLIFTLLVEVGSNNNFVTNLKLGFLDSFKTWLLRFFKVDCLDFCRASGFFSSLGDLQMNHLSSLFIELKKGVFRQDFLFSLLWLWN